MKKISWLLVLCLSLDLLLLMLWPSVRASATAERGSEALGGELMLWMLPTVSVICLMPDIREEKNNGR